MINLERGEMGRWVLTLERVRVRVCSCVERGEHAV